MGRKKAAPKEKAVKPVKNPFRKPLSNNNREALLEYQERMRAIIQQNISLTDLVADAEDAHMLPPEAIPGMKLSLEYRYKLLMLVVPQVKSVDINTRNINVDVQTMSTKELFALYDQNHGGKILDGDTDEE